MTRVLLAPDKFRGSLTAPEAAAAFAHGVRQVVPDVEVTLRPVADGGEGTVDAFVDAGWEPVAVQCAGPTGEPVSARYARRGSRAVVELAECCGMQRLPDGRPEPLRATSRGAGDAVAAALRAGAREVVVGVGGSASTDGGLGLLAALGVVVRDADGRPLPAAPESLHHATTVDPAGVLPELHGARIVVATDVTNPLTGRDGAAAVFGPQKGASAAAGAGGAAGGVPGETVWGGGGRRVDDLAGGGAAGGVPAGLIGALGGIAAVSVVSGAETVVDLVGIEAALSDCGLVLVGEGSFDTQSLAGKAPTVVARAAVRAGVPVALVAGRIGVAEQILLATGFAHSRALVELAAEGEDPLRDAAELAARAAAQIARAVLG